MSDLTNEERAWLKRLKSVLDQCPSGRLGFFTSGDPTVTVYDRTKEEVIDELSERKGADFGACVDEVGAYLDMIHFPSNVHAVAG